jgi:hypothetical protein
LYYFDAARRAMPAKQETNSAAGAGAAATFGAHLGFFQMNTPRRAAILRARRRNASAARRLARAFVTAFPTADA